MQNPQQGCKQAYAPHLRRSIRHGWIRKISKLVHPFLECLPYMQMWWLHLRPFSMGRIKIRVSRFFKNFTEIG